MKSFARELENVDLDMSTMTMDEEAQTQLAEYGPCVTIFGQLNRFDSLLRMYGENSVPLEPYLPVSRYGKAALSLLEADSGNIKQSIDHVFCREAELQLVRSLQDTTTFGGHERPVTILVDEERTPVGVVKHHGEETLYTWKTVTIPTLKNPSGVTLPAGAFSDIDYHYPLYYEANGQNVHVLAATPKNIGAVRFGRLDMTHYSTAIRESIIQDVLEDSGKRRAFFAPHAHDSIHYNPRTIGHRVAALLKRAS
ncbi:MAG: hypothetical protein JWO41_555 [Candidatus Saccharibacteria bacterium]|nr:hypothetical protein [Candidatus Saccharibacteria bacterium]